MERYGIATAGNWIVDRVKLIDRWPEEETLAFIASETRGGGGGAYNCIVDLQRLGVEAPLTAIGCVGDDADGEWIRNDLEARRIDPTHLHTCSGAPTAYTDVMTVAGSGKRTFFYNAGANAQFGVDSVPCDDLAARVVHLAYLLVLPLLDEEDPDFGSVGARLLARLRERGLLTSLDVITQDAPRVQRIVKPALAHVDCLVINEVEAGVISGIATRPGGVLDPAAVRAAARALLDEGVHRWVVIHAPEGGYGLERDGDEAALPSLRVPDDFIVSAVGAGDAFAGGVLYALHESWPLERALRLGVATATACLRHATTTGGVGSMDETLALLDQYPFREAII